MVFQSLRVKFVGECSFDVIFFKLSKAVNSQCNHIHYRCCVGYGVGRTCVGQKFILTVNNMMKHTCKNTHRLTLSANVAMHAEMYLKHYP